MLDRRFGVDGVELPVYKSLSVFDSKSPQSDG